MLIACLYTEKWKSQANYAQHTQAGGLIIVLLILANSVYNTQELIGLYTTVVQTTVSE